MIKIETNFSFQKLATQLPKLITGLTNRGALDAKTQSSKTLKGGLRVLKESTLETRKLRGQGKKPLIADGGLLGSLKSSKSKLSFFRYGLYHDDPDGFITKNRFFAGKELYNFFNKGKGVQVPGRPWVFREYTKENIKKFFQGFHKALRK